MGIWNIEILTEGECGENRWILFDSCDMKPIAIASVNSYEESEGLLRFCREQTAADLRSLDSVQLESLHNQWHAAGRPTWSDDEDARETVRRLEAAT